MSALIIGPVLIFVFMYIGFALLRMIAEGKERSLPRWMSWLSLGVAGRPAGDKTTRK